MNAKVEATAMLAGSTIVETITINVVAIQLNSASFLKDHGSLSFVVPSVGGNSISAINPEFVEVGVLAAA